MTSIPSFAACLSFEPAPGPATTRSVFAETEPAEEDFLQQRNRDECARQQGIQSGGSEVSHARERAGRARGIKSLHRRRPQPFRRLPRLRRRGETARMSPAKNLAAILAAAAALALPAGRVAAAERVFHLLPIWDDLTSLDDSKFAEEPKNWLAKKQRADGKPAGR